MPIHPNVPQCNHIKVDGNRCGSPAISGLPKCHFHNHILRAPTHFVFAPLEDANAVQVVIMEIMRALLEDRIDRAKAATLLYGCQIAQSNLRNLSLVGRQESVESDEGESLASILLRELRESEQEQAEKDSATREQERRDHEAHKRLNPHIYGKNTATDTKTGTSGP